jgi:two-component SAPR family response regulator
MPGLTGVETAKQMLSIKPETKIIFSTGYDMHDTLESEAGSIDAPVIYKPCKYTALSQAIHDQLKK